MNHINANTVIGILGSGQLSRMSSLAAAELGIKTSIYCDSEKIKSPASLVNSNITHGSLKNLDQILYFAKNCDYLTLENEFIDSSILKAIDEKFPNKLFPNSHTFNFIGDKISEKKYFSQMGLPIGPYTEIKSKADIIKFAQTHSYPLILKKSKGGYDGFGNFKINSENQIDEALDKMNFNSTNKPDLLVERFIHYKKELAVVGVKNSFEQKIYPIVETHQDNHICHFVSAPADIAPETENEINKLTNLALAQLPTRGLFAFEYFLDQNDQIYFNESAPRPHNSAHYTMNACKTSQFKNHILSVLDLPLGSTDMIYPATVMLNLLGTQNGIAELKPLNQFLNSHNAFLHLYGKEFSKPGRKMGHITFVGSNKAELFSHAQKLKEIYSL